MVWSAWDCAFMFALKIDGLVLSARVVMLAFAFLCVRPDHKEICLCPFGNCFAGYLSRTSALAEL